ncbi:MAG: type II toxin-antitoxin system Phd/YefM family antitoxin [Xanthobacteraceae bacterium]|nr:type II toxin-antitoxin system Phd/YefM family antitoxin [Xanthobacteraceae bacterium]
MRVSITEAAELLTDLVTRAELGEEIIITRDGHAAARLVPMSAGRDGETRKAILEAVRASGRAKTSAVPSADHSQDFLYDEHGEPE